MELGDRDDMKLELESGREVMEAMPEDIRRWVPGEEFAILLQSDMTYMQCATRDDGEGGYVLEYQDGSLSEHYAALGMLSEEQVINALLGYLAGESHWRAEFLWEKQAL
jgi:hypothetical protein